MKKILDWAGYSETARAAAAEGCVLLKNDNRALPVRAGETVSVFGRIQLDYYKSGTGSGGMVNVPYVRTLIDGLQSHSEIQLYEPLLDSYREWEKDHLFDNGNGWGTEPWCQEEMELTDEQIQDAKEHSDLALIVIGRTAGEDRDNSAQPGSYYLTEDERTMLRRVCAAFPRTAVLLNVGNIMDMNWVNEYAPSAVLYIWQGGMEGGLGAADVICGSVSPSGKLPDTIAYKLQDYPSSRNFGSKTENVYEEDIYVGYRYFETFAPGRVQYPFGFGLSYTTFAVSSRMQETESEIEILAEVTNTGSCAGKEVVQVYAQAPQGLLGKPARVLCGFVKTALLAPGESETLEITVAKASLASYDDGGVTGEKSCYVLEPGTYSVYAGTDVRSAVKAGSFEISALTVTERCQESMAPVKKFSRMHPAVSVSNTDDAPNASGLQISMEEVPVRTINPADKRLAALPVSVPCTGDRGLLLADVAAGRCSMQDFLAQLSDEDLIHIVHGEGMCSPKVTPGTAGAIGGVTERLQHFGIPAGCCSDGPSGIRMDCGEMAFSLPNGTLLAASFNLALVEELFGFEGLELYSHQIDTLLGPGINIHRHPLNGRNFEYHSEDPYLTGMMAAAQAKGMNQHHITPTIKHFCGNNQETRRQDVNTVVSERALREIYLKPFEIAVRSGCVRSVMTSYNPVNGIWTAGNYDLNTSILRNEWGFDGIVMTDWWADINNDGGPSDKHNLSAMVRSQNDLYMVVPDAAAYDDNLHQELADGRLTRGELMRSAANICSFLLASPAFERVIGTYLPTEHRNRPEGQSLDDLADMEQVHVTNDTTVSLKSYPTDAGTYFLLALNFDEQGMYNFSLSASTEATEHAQLAVTLTLDSTVLHTFSYHGGSDEITTISREKDVRGNTHYLKVFFSHTGLTLHTLRIERIGDL